MSENTDIRVSDMGAMPILLHHSFSIFGKARQRSWEGFISPSSLVQLLAPCFFLLTLTGRQLKITAGGVMAKASRHGRQRVKERVGIRANSANRQAELAKERGLYHKDTSGSLFKWISACSLKYGTSMGATYIVYNNKLFVFDRACDILVTVLNLPSNLSKNASLQVSKQKKKA